MPVIVLEAKDFANPLFWVRTCEVLASCTTFSLVSSLDPSELFTNQADLQNLQVFRIYCMVTWCFFFTVSLLIHVLSIIQFHSLLPISWKNLTVTVAVLGSLMCLSACVLFSWIVVNLTNVRPCSVVATVASCITFFAFTAESYILCTQAQEQRGYLGSMPGLLKIIQLWGGCQMILLGLKLNHLHIHTGFVCVCLSMSLVILVVILCDFAGKCPLPFDKILTGICLFGVLVYMVATVICFANILKLRQAKKDRKYLELAIMDTVAVSITLFAYTVDLAFSIKLLCNRSH